LLQFVSLICNNLIGSLSKEEVDYSTKILMNDESTLEISKEEFRTVSLNRKFASKSLLETVSGEQVIFTQLSFICSQIFIFMF
jgi:hypothetical protein